MRCKMVAARNIPECTPACSICCMIPQMVTLPSLSHRASTSSSSARSMYLSTNTGLSGSTSTAFSMYRFRSVSLQCHATQSMTHCSCKCAITREAFHVGCASTVSTLTWAASFDCAMPTRATGRWIVQFHFPKRDICQVNTVMTAVTVLQGLKLQALQCAKVTDAVRKGSAKGMSLPWQNASCALFVWP